MLFEIFHGENDIDCHNFNLQHSLTYEHYMHDILPFPLRIHIKHVFNSPKGIQGIPNIMTIEVIHLPITDKQSFEKLLDFVRFITWLSVLGRDAFS